MVCKIGIILYFIVQTAALILYVVGTPIDMFRAKDQDTVGNTACMTLWGFKEKCYSTKYDTKTDDMFDLCTKRRDRFRASQALAIITICVYAAGAVLGFIMLCCCGCFRWLCLILNIGGVATGCVPWACMAYVYSNSQGLSLDCVKFNLSSKYGAGFALLIAGWGLNLINIAFLMLPC